MDAYRNKWRRYRCDDRAAEPLTVGNNDKRRRAAQTAGHHEGLHRSIEVVQNFQHMQLARQVKVNRRVKIPSMNFHFRYHFLLQPCKVAAK